VLRYGRLYLFVLSAAALGVAAVAGSAQAPDPEAYQQQSRAFSARMEKTGLAVPFKGVTTNGAVVPNLFEIRSTGVPTEPVRSAAAAFLKSLSAAQRTKTIFPVDHEEWRKWANQHMYFREGMSFENMTADQRQAAFAMLGASLSAKGLKLTRDIMHLNETLGELNANNFVEYGEWKFWISMMGEPSPTEPWGWQLDGHHLILNYFVLGDQVVMTPAFWGSEPTVATSGKYAGTAILKDEQNRGLAMIRALTPEQRGRAILQASKNGNNILAQAFSDNVVLDLAGVRVSSFSDSQKKQLLELIGLYVGNLREGHARVHMADVEKHLGETYFAWIGETNDNSVYYYRVQSPVILIEFDHQTPVGLRHLYPAGVPYREHIHSVVRTPNGNDYGKDLLRQNYRQHPH
jgi:Spy/CpxP family protein refolding chaperone